MASLWRVVLLQTATVQHPLQQQAKQHKHQDFLLHLYLQ